MMYEGTNPEIGGARDAIRQALGEVAVIIDVNLFALNRVGVEANVSQVKNFGR
jgi:hypothetical protein